MQRQIRQFLVLIHSNVSCLTTVPSTARMQFLILSKSLTVRHHERFFEKRNRPEGPDDHGHRLHVRQPDGDSGGFEQHARQFQGARSGELAQGAGRGAGVGGSQVPRERESRP